MKSQILLLSSIAGFATAATDPEDHNVMVFTNDKCDAAIGQPNLGTFEKECGTCGTYVGFSIKYNCDDNSVKVWRESIVCEGDATETITAASDKCIIGMKTGEVVSSYFTPNRIDSFNMMVTSGSDTECNTKAVTKRPVCGMCSVHIGYAVRYDCDDDTVKVWRKLSGECSGEETEKVTSASDKCVLGAGPVFGIKTSHFSLNNKDSFKMMVTSGSDTECNSKVVTHRPVCGMCSIYAGFAVLYDCGDDTVKVWRKLSGECSGDETEKVTSATDNCVLGAAPVLGIKTSHFSLAYTSQGASLSGAATYSIVSSFVIAAMALALF